MLPTPRFRRQADVSVTTQSFSSYRHAHGHDQRGQQQDEQDSSWSGNIDPSCFSPSSVGARRSGSPVDPRERESAAAAGSLSKTKMDHEMALVHHGLTFPDRSSISSKSDDAFEPMDEKLAVVVAQQSIADDSDDPDDEEVVDYAPLRMVKAGRVESEQEKLHTHPAHNIVTYKRKRGRPTGLQSFQSKMVQKPVLMDSASSSSSSINSENDKGDDFVPMASNVKGQKKWARVQDICGSSWEKALEVQEKLPGDAPSFVKRMLQSHVVRGFWLGLPCKFCKEHLPKHDVAIALEDEYGNSYNTKYLGNKQGLSAGWRDFAIKHGLKVGDVVVFQLVRSTRFKVYILGENKFTSTTDGALSLLSLDTSKENKSTEESSDDDVKSKEDAEVTRISSAVGEDDSDNPACKEAVDGGIRFSASDINFDDVTSFLNFSIVVNSLVIDREIPNHLRKTYYELCGARKSFLHKHLLKQINLSLVVGVIMETATIANGIRAYNYSHEDLAAWKKTLESFELLGMDVAFMLKRVDDLLGVPSPQPIDPEVDQEMKRMLGLAREEMKVLESKVSGVKDTLKEIDAKMKTSVRRSAREMRRKAAAPW